MNRVAPAAALLALFFMALPAACSCNVTSCGPSADDAEASVTPVHTCCGAHQPCSQQLVDDDCDCKCSPVAETDADRTTPVALPLATAKTSLAGVCPARVSMPAIVERTTDRNLRNCVWRC